MGAILGILSALSWLPSQLLLKYSGPVLMQILGTFQFVSQFEEILYLDVQAGWENRSA